jgi:hypothetical protein
MSAALDKYSYTRPWVHLIIHTIDINKGDLMKVKSTGANGAEWEAGATGSLGLIPTIEIPPSTNSIALQMRRVERNPVRSRRKFMMGGKMAPPRPIPANTKDAATDRRWEAH